jgi:hypothetical protein
MEKPRDIMGTSGRLEGMVEVAEYALGQGLDHEAAFC